MHAVRLGGIPRGERVAAQHVDLVCDGFEVFRVDARALPAEMVKLEAVGQLAPRQQPHCTVRRHAYAVGARLAVADVADEASPQPTARVWFGGDLRHDARRERQGAPPFPPGIEMSHPPRFVFVCPSALSSSR